MKTVRTFSILMAVIMLATAVLPTPAAALQSASLTSASPAVGSAFDSSLFAPLSMTNPLIPQYNDGSALGYSCTLVNQSPKDWVTMKPRQSFDMMWTVLNTGRTWNADYTQFKYLWGAKMQTRGDFFDLYGNVGRGKRVKLGIDMIAPKTPGTYPITWGLYSGGIRVCTLTFIVTVVR